MSNNLQRVDLAPGQTADQYATMNTSVGRVDAALTAKLDVSISTLGAYTVNLSNLTQNFEFKLVPAGSPPVAPFTLSLANTGSVPRGLVYIRNTTAQPATISSPGQTLPAPVLAGGTVGLFYVNATDTVAVINGAPLTDAPSDGFLYGRLNSTWTKAVQLAGDTMTGALQVPAGSAALSGLRVGASDHGLSQAAGVISINAAGVSAATFTASGMTINRTGGASTAALVITSDFFSAYQQSFHAAGAGAPSFVIRKARGTTNVPSVISQNDVLMLLQGHGYGATAFKQAGYIQVSGISAAPSDTDMEGRVFLGASPAGTVVSTEIVRLDHATGMSMFGANVVIDDARNFRLRSYTIATLPAHVAGKEVYCSDLGGGGGALVSNGTSWLRLSDGFTSSASLIAFTNTHLTSAVTTELTGTIVADRIITLGAAPAGSRWKFISIGAHAFKHDVGGITNLFSGQWVTMITDGTTWRVEEKGYVKTPAVFAFNYMGAPPVSSRLWAFVAPFAFELPDQYVGSQGWCQTAPGATIAFDVRKNNVSIGTMTFTSANTATFVNAAAGVDSFAIGDRLSVHSPAALNTLADLAVSFKGTRLD